MTSNIVHCVLVILSLLPRRVSQVLGKLIGWCCYHLNSRVTRVCRVNIGMCKPDLSLKDQESLVRRSLVQTGQTMMEIPAIWLGSSKRIESWIESVRDEHLFAAAKQTGQGVIVLLPHFGNWELFNVYFRRHGSMTALYQPPRQAALRPLMEGVRQSGGNELVATNLKGVARLYRCLEQGNVVTILPDQVPASGIFTPFFNVDALTDPLIPRLVRKTGAVVVAALVRRLPNGLFSVEWHQVDEGVYDNDMVQATRAMNQTVEYCVASDLEQYQWEYKRFKVRPAGEKNVYHFHR